MQRYNNHFRNSNRRPPVRGGRGRAAKRPLDASLFVKKANPAIQMAETETGSFDGFRLSGALVQNINRSGYKNPTPVQKLVIPHVLAGRDVVGVAQTGTGKTAAFLLPIIEQSMHDSKRKTLIIAPTRELAGQIFSELKKFSAGVSYYGALCVGGMPMGRQIDALRRNHQCVVGTPGRLKDLERQRVLFFDAFSVVVLDEVDRMMDMGFIRDIEYIMGKTRKDRQTLFFSATIAEDVKRIMQKFLKDPVHVTVEQTKPSEQVNQDIVRTRGKDKVEILHEMLIQREFSKVLLFGRTKWGVERLSKQLATRGFRVAVIHGNKRQSQRDRALEEFKRSRVQLLLATDVASRGIDVSDITHVINYDPPDTYDEYIHRIGRTGRAGKTGSAITFVD